MKSPWAQQQFERVDSSSGMARPCRGPAPAIISKSSLPKVTPSQQKISATVEIVLPNGEVLDPISVSRTMSKEVHAALERANKFNGYVRIIGAPIKYFSDERGEDAATISFANLVIAIPSDLAPSFLNSESAVASVSLRKNHTRGTIIVEKVSISAPDSRPENVSLQGILNYQIAQKVPDRFIATKVTSISSEHLTATATLDSRPAIESGREVLILPADFFQRYGLSDAPIVRASLGKTDLLARADLTDDSNGERCISITPLRTGDRITGFRASEGGATREHLMDQLHDANGKLLRVGWKLWLAGDRRVFSDSEYLLFTTSIGARPRLEIAGRSYPLPLSYSNRRVTSELVWDTKSGDWKVAGLHFHSFTFRDKDGVVQELIPAEECRLVYQENCLAGLKSIDGSMLHRYPRLLDGQARSYYSVNQALNAAIKRGSTGTIENVESNLLKSAPLVLRNAEIAQAVSELPDQTIVSIHVEHGQIVRLIPKKSHVVIPRSERWIGKEDSGTEGKGSTSLRDLFERRQSWFRHVVNDKTADVPHALLITWFTTSELEQLGVKALASPAPSGTQTPVRTSKLHRASATQEELIAHFLAQDFSVIPDLIENIRPRIFNYLLRRVGTAHSDKAEDLTQLAQLRLLSALYRFKGTEPESFWRYVWHTAASVKIDNDRRKVNREVVFDEASDQESLAVTYNDKDLELIFHRADVSVILEAARKLDQESPLQKINRERLLIMYAHQVSYEEMAEYFQVKLGTIKSAVHRVTAAIEKMIQPAASKTNQ